MTEEMKTAILPSDVNDSLGVWQAKTGDGYSAFVRAPSFSGHGAEDSFDERTKKERRARFRASADMLFSTDVSKLDDAGASALYQSVTEGMFGLPDEDGSVAFGKRAAKDPRQNIEMLRKFVKGDYTLIEDPEYTKWRQMDDEAKFKYALESETTGNKLRSYMKGERGAGFWENMRGGVGMSIVGLPAGAVAFQPDYIRAQNEKIAMESARRSNYETLTDEEKEKYRADVVADYDEKLSRRQTLATFLQFAHGLSDRAGYLLAKSFNDGTPDAANIEGLPEDERDRVYAAFSLMRGDQKKGQIFWIDTDFTDDTAANRLQLMLYGFQQSVVGLVTDTADLARDAAMWTYAKTAMDEAERKEFFKGWDANVRAEQAMKQSLPEASGIFGEAFQGLSENLHWFIPYSMIGKGGKLAKGARAAVTTAKLQQEVAEGGLTLAKAAAEASRARWLADVEGAVKAGKGARKISEFSSAIAMRRQLAAVEQYTAALREIPNVVRAAKWKDAAGAGMWAAGEASAFSAFASEYVANADAAGISREESVLTAAAIGLINAKIEQLYVPGLESSLSPAQIKSLTFAAMAQAIKTDGAAGFRKWLANRVSKGVTEGVKVTLTEGAVEEPLQQMAIEHGKAFDKLCGELRANGQATLANEAKALWDSFARTLPNDYATFIDTAADMVPSSLGFGVTTIGNMTRRQHIHNVMTRHANRRAGAQATDTMFNLDQRGEDPSKAFDYDAGLVDVIQQAVNVRSAVEKHWQGEEDGGETKNPHRFEEAITAARRAWRDPQTGDAVQEIADAAGVDVKTAEVLAQYLQTEAEAAAFSPQARAWTSLNMSLADIDEATIKTVLPGYVEGSFASDPENGIYSGRVRMDDGTEKTIAYRVGDLSAELVAEAQNMAKADSSFGKSFDARHAELGDGVTWASLSDAQRYAEAIRSQASVNGFSTGKSGVFELTDSKGEKVRVNADDIIYLANGLIGDIGYGPAATQGTVRHETFHSLWRFVRGTLADADVQQLAKTLGIDVTNDGWEVELDEKMAHEMERYASGHYVSHAVSSRFDKMLDSWAGKIINFFGQFGPSDEVTDPKTGKPYQLKGLYDSILRGELGSGALGVELRKVPAQPATTASTASTSAMPVEVTDADRAEAEAKAQEEAANETKQGVGETKQGVGETKQGVGETKQVISETQTATSENPADAATPNQRYYKVGLPNSPVKLVGRLEVRDVDTGIITSTDADYHDRGNQNRDDKSEESRALVEKIGANPDPLQIGTVQPIASNGIIWMLPNGDVIIGNHRVNGVRLGYAKGTTAELEKFVREDAAKRGIEIGADVKKPLMVFVLERIESPDGKADVHEVVRLANESQNRGFNIREQAGNDAKILTDNNLLPRMEFRADGRIDETKSGDAIGKFRQESGAQGLIAEDGSLTEEGQTRIQNAALAVLLGGEGNNALLNKIMTNAGRLDMQSELRALMKMTPELMALAETKPDYDLRAPIAEALQLFTEWRDKDETARVEKGKTRHDWRETTKDGTRKRGLSWEAYLSQGDMFRKPSDEAKILGDLFAKAESLRSFDREDVESAAGKKRVIDLISDYLADYIANARAVNTETDDMFGGSPASRADVLAAQRATGGEIGGETSARFSIDSAYNPRSNIPNVRGGWNEKKILRYLKANPSLHGVRTAARLISEFDTVDELKNHMFYHGTRNYVGSMQPSMTQSERWAQEHGGGGYGQRYWGISVSKSKKIASNFGNPSPGVSIYPVVLAKGAKVIDRPDLTDAADVEDHIVELWNDGVDAVRLGDWSKDTSEQELLVLNPRAICNIGTADSYRYFKLGSDENPLDIKDDAHIARMLEAAREYADYSPVKRFGKPVRPSLFYPSGADGTIGEMKPREVIEAEKAQYEKDLAAWRESEQGIAAAEYEWNMRDAIRYSIGGVYTGTAADYANRSREGGKGDGPSLLKIGTGEGSQVYGWGLYGSAVRGVAEGYANPSGRISEVLVNGERHKAVGVYEVVASMLKNGDAKEFIKDTLGALDEMQYALDESGKSSTTYGIRTIDQKYIDKRRAEIKEAQRIINEGATLAKPGNLYEQTFFTDRAPGDESHLLKWYEPVSKEQTEWIFTSMLPGHGNEFNKAIADYIASWRSKIKAAEKDPNAKKDLAYRAEQERGEDLYRVVEEALGSTKAASEFLARAGIDGVKYPVDSYGKTVKDGDKAGWNYVSFRDDNIRVDHKWTDGQQRYSIAQTATPQFKRWFGDWENDPANASKVVDRAGRPRVVYHGTPNGKFWTFDKNRIGETWNADETGFFFTSDRHIAEDYTKPYFRESSADPNLFAVYLSIKNPLVIDRNWWQRNYGRSDIYNHDAIEIWDNEQGTILDEMRKGGHDGVIIDPNPMGGAAKMYMVPEPTQIKSATDNTGAFDPRNPDIRYSIAPAVANPDVQVAKETAEQRYSVFAGEKTATPRLLKPLAEAKAMLGDGQYTDAVRREIYDKTGWWRGNDGKWRVELPNLKAKYFDADESVEFADADVILEKYGWNEYSAYWLRDLVTFPKGLKANMYELGETLVFFVDEEQMKSASGGEDASAATFVRVEQGLFGPQVTCEIHVVDPMADERERKGRQRLAQSTLDSLTHELQHVIQLREGFSFGGNTADAGGDRAYGAAAGEVEARNAARRNDPQNRIRPPWATEDVPARYQSVGYSGWEWTDADGWRPMAETAALSPAAVRPAAEGRRYSVSAPLVAAMQERERRANAPRSPQGESPFFAEAEGAVEIPVRALRTVKDEPERSIRSAAFKMHRAAAGSIPKRAPVSVVENGDGTYTVIDGNATTRAAARGGLESVRAKIVGKDRGTRLRNSGYLMTQRKDGADADGELRTHGLDGLSGEVARERMYEQAEANKDALRAVVDAAARVVGGEAKHRKSIKKRARVDEKAKGDYGDDYSRVVDLIGGTVVMPDSGDFTDAVKAIEKNLPQGASIAKVKPFHFGPNDTGYQDVKVSVRFANGGIGEIILVEKYLNDAKFNSGGHTVYDSARVLDGLLDRADKGEIKLPPEIRRQVEEVLATLREFSAMIYARGPEAVAFVPDFERMKAFAASQVQDLLPIVTGLISSKEKDAVKSSSSEFHLAKPPSVDSYAMPKRSFIQNDISDSSLLNGKTSGSVSNFSLTVNGENDNSGKFSVAPPRSGLVYPQLRSMSDDELLSAAVAVRMALGTSDKLSDKTVKINTVQKIMRRLHPDWDGPKIGLESQRVLLDARKFGKRIREDLNRGVSDSLILEHLPQAAREQFGFEMRQEARKGQSLGVFGQKVASAIEERQARVVEDAVRVQTGIDAAIIENVFDIDLSATLMHLAENPLSQDDGKGVSGTGSGEEENAVPAEEKDVEAKVVEAVSAVVDTARQRADENAEIRRERKAHAEQQKKDGEAEGETGDESGDALPGDAEDAVAVAVKKAGLDLENPRHLAEFVAELTRRYWIKEHGLAITADVWHDLVAVQFLRKTAQSVYAKLCKDLVYSRSRETAMQRIAKLDAVPTVAGLLSEMEFVGALINAQRIRDTQKQLCEKLDLFLRQKFGAQGRFKPDKEEGQRSVSAEAELRARYMRHAMWLTPDAVADEARQLQETLDALSVDFKDAGRDRDQSREFVETIRKLNVLREFGALRYKPVGEIEAAAQWWEDFARGESDDIVREMSDRDIRTKKAAHLLAVAFADPKRTTIREGGKADALNRFITGHMGFISLLQDCMRHASDADAAAVKDIVDYISREIQKSGDRSEAEKRRHNDAFHSAVEGIYGKNFNAVMKDMMAPDERFTKYMGVVGGKRVTPTKGRALQLLVSLLQEGRKVQVEDEDNPGQTKTVWEGGYHDNIVKHHREGQAAEIMRLLDPADMNMLKWLGQWYENNRADLSGVCHSLFGIGVYAELPNYFPVKMQLETQGLEKGNGVGWTIFPKALTPRVRNERDFDTSADIFSMWASRMEEAAQWKHHAQLGLEMRGIFGRAELREAVRANHGASVDELMQGFITDILAGHGAYDRSTAGVQYFSDQIRGWTALCALGGNVGVMAKQTTSIPAFGFEIGLVNTAKYMVNAFTPEGMAAMRRIWDSEQRRTRWQVGSSEAVRNALNQQGAGALKRMFQASMITNKLGDVVPALVVGQGIYRDCLARGMSEEDAMAETWSLVERTQQSGRMENQTSIQRRNKLGRIMFQFLSTQQQYLQYEVRAIREVIARPDSVKRWGSLGRAILLNHFILSSAYYWMGQLYKYALGQEPPEDELKDWIVTCLLGPYGSLFVAGFCCKYTLERAIKGYSIKGGSSMLPMESWLKNQVNDGAKLLEAIFDSDGDTWDNMLEAAGRWMSDSNSTVRDLRKLYRYRIKEEPQNRR